MSSLDHDAVADLVEELDGGHAAVRRVPREPARAFTCKFERRVVIVQIRLSEVA